MKQFSSKLLTVLAIFALICIISHEDGQKTLRRYLETYFTYIYD
jgi:hypothetical protein